VSEPVRILIGDVLDGLRSLPDGSAQCCVTSPPYWGLRDYGVDGQIGLEPTPEAFVAKMVEVFREVRRVLREDGVCFLNIGDSYATGTTANRQQSPNPGVGANCPEAQNSVARIGTPAGLKTKDLCGIPWRVVLALQADGWYWRSCIVWAKKSPMPESVTDRPTSSWEPIFLLAKGERYFYDSFAVRERDAEAVKSYNNLHENKRGIHEGVESEAGEPSQVEGVGRTVQAKRQRQGEPRGVLKVQEDGGESGDMEIHSGGSGVCGPIPQVSEEEAGACPLLQQREGQGCNRPLSEDAQGRGILTSRSSQASGTAETDCVRPNCETVAGNTGSSEPCVRDVQESISFDSRSRSANQQGRVAHGGKHSSVVPELQQQEGQSVGRNQRNVWHLGPEPYSEAHFATFPTEIPRRAILAGTSEKGACPDCGAPWKRITTREKLTRERPNDFTKRDGEEGTGNSCANTVAGVATTTLGWEPTCKCGNPNTVPCVVLDPFLGSGTTIAVARTLGRHGVGCELNPAYAELARERIGKAEKPSTFVSAKADESPLFSGATK
jgi:DNA modification methylase